MNINYGRAPLSPLITAPHLHRLLGNGLHHHDQPWLDHWCVWRVGSAIIFVVSDIINIIMTPLWHSWLVGLGFRKKGLCVLAFFVVSSHCLVCFARYTETMYCLGELQLLLVDLSPTANGVLTTNTHVHYHVHYGNGHVQDHIQLTSVPPIAMFVGLCPLPLHWSGVLWLRQ